jgi:hypothetical protein
VNPTPDQVLKIKSFVAALPGGWSNGDAAIRAAMAASTVANPTQRATVAKPFALAALLGALSGASQANLNSVPGQAQLIQDIRANDAASCLNWVAFLSGTAKITAQEAAALAAIVQATEPDPAWTSTLPWDVANLGRPCDDFDLEAARHAP